MVIIGIAHVQVVVVHILITTALATRITTTVITTVRHAQLIRQSQHIHHGLHTHLVLPILKTYLYSGAICDTSVKYQQ